MTSRRRWIFAIASSLEIILLSLATVTPLEFEDRLLNPFNSPTTARPLMGQSGPGSDSPLSELKLRVTCATVSCTMRMTKYFFAVLALVTGCSYSPKTQAPAAVEQLAADTPKTTVEGNMFIAPAGWSFSVRGPATILQ